MNDFSSEAEHIKEFSEKIEAPTGLEVARLCDFAESLLNGNIRREEELRNIMNFVSLSVQGVLRAVNDPGRRAIKIERLKGRLYEAHQRLAEMSGNNSNGNHDRLGEIVL